MAKRSITDEEIGLIKAMLSRGMRNSSIQFYFNRPDRQVNTGRITDIGDRTHSNAAAIPAATDIELNTVLASYTNGYPRSSMVNVAAHWFAARTMAYIGAEWGFLLAPIRAD